MTKLNYISILFFTILSCVLFLSFDNPDNPPTGYSGATAATCGNCHGGGSFGGAVNILGVPSSIAPNTTYSITVTTTKTTGSTKKAGFQLSATVGTLSTTSSNVRIQDNHAEHLETSTAQNFVSASGISAKTWTFNWTSPATTTNNNITFYVSSVLGNGASGTGGDQVVNNTAMGTFTAASPLTVTQVAKTNVTCKGSANGTASVNATGGTGCSYTYNWSNGQTGQFISSLAAGVYTVTATCGTSTGSTSITITEPSTILTCNVTGSTLSCVGGNNGTVSASASGGGSSYTYAWSNGQLGATQNNLTAGIYSVTVTDNNGCTLIKNAMVSNPSNPVSASTSTTSATCISQGTATVNATNGTGPYTYLWSNGQNLATASSLNSGNYTVTVTDSNGCKTTSSATVNANTTPPPSSISGNSSLTCAQSTATLAAPMGAYNYAWSNGENGNMITVNTANNYQVTVTDPTNGCTSTSSKNVTEDKMAPTATINGNSVLTCSENQLTLTSNGNNSFLWSGPSIISGVNSPSVTLNGSGTYFLTVTSLNNGCTSVLTKVVSENKTTPPIPSIGPTNPTITCSNSFVTLSSTVGGSFNQNWSYNGSFLNTGAQTNATQAGNYLLVVTDPNNGCTSSNFITVNSTKTTLSVATTGGKITCANPNITLTANASGAVSYNWVSSTFNSNQQNPSVNNPGTYTVIATDVNGCTGSSQATVTNDTQKPNVIASVNGMISCSNPTVTLNASSSTGGLSYSWASSNGFSGSGNPITTQQSGTYTVTATNPLNGCSNTATTTVSASNDKPILTTSGGSITCKDTVANINVVVTGNTSGLTYKWSGANNFTSNSTSSNVKTAGDYIVTVTAGNGCSSIATAKVILDNLPISAQIESNKNFICSNDTLKLSAKSVSSISNYVWSNANTSSSINISKSGTYSLTVTGSNGCKGNTNIVITDGKSPVLTANADSLTCAINKLIINANISWPSLVAPIWTGPDNFTSSVLQPEISKPGIYQLSVNPSDGCSNSISIEVKENKKAPIIKINAAKGLQSCDSIPIVLKVSSSAKSNSYLWTGPNLSSNNKDSIVANQSAKYLVKVTDEKGCVANDSVQVTLYPKINVLLDITACEINKGVASLNITGGKAPFEISNSKGVKISSSIFNSDNNLFPLRIKDANDCISTLNKFDKVISAPLFVDKTLTKVVDETENKKNGSITLTVTSNYSDFNNNKTYVWTTGASSKDITGLGSANYCVTVTNGFGCSLVECFNVKNLIATEDKLLAQSIKVSPNPVSNILFIDIDKSIEINNVYIINGEGKVLFFSDKILNQIDISEFPQGLYFIKLMDKKGRFSIKKVMKL